MIGLFAAKLHGGHEHQEIHDQVDLGRHDGKDPVDTGNVGHKGVQQGNDGRHYALGHEDVLLDALLVQLLEVRGQIALLAADQEQALAGASQPGQHAGEAGADDHERQDRRQEFYAELSKEGLEGLHQTGGQAHGLSRNHPRDG